MQTVINYWWLLAALILLLALLTWMIKRNLKDKNKFEKDFMRSEIPPRKHTEDEIEDPK